MFAANLAALTLSHMSAAAVFFQEAVGWDPISVWHQMGYLARAVVVILFISKCMLRTFIQKIVDTVPEGVL